MINLISIFWIFFISIGCSQKEENVQVEKHYTLVNNIYSENNKDYIDADYVQYFIGDKAVAEAKKRKEADSFIVNGQTVYSVPSDFYIVNENNKIRKLEVANDVKLDLVSSYDSKNDAHSITINHLRKDYKYKLFLLTIQNGKVIEIKEIFTP